MFDANDSSQISVSFGVLNDAVRNPSAISPFLANLRAKMHQYLFNSIVDSHTQFCCVFVRCTLVKALTDITEHVCVFLFP